MYDFRKQGVDYQKVGLLFAKWPIYAFRLLRRGRFETIAELRRDAYQLNRLVNGNTDSSRSLRSNSSPDFLLGVQTTLMSPRTALTWGFVLIAILLADQYVLIPELRGVVATLLAGSSLLTVLVMLSSITRESSSTAAAAEQHDKFWISNLLGGAFFLVSTFPFAMPWIVAFFFPRQCLLFFSTWALFGAVIGEISVLVSRAKLDAATSQAKKDLLEEKIAEAVVTASPSVSFQVTERVRPQAARKRTRKTTEQRIATVKNFTVDDRRDLEDYLVSDEGIKWWAAFLAMQGCIAGAAVFLRLIADLFVDDLDFPVVNASLLLLSLCLFCESFWITYAAGGRWLHFRKQWRFFQPFKGGARFRSFQIPAWLLFFVFLFKTVSDMRPTFQIAFRELTAEGDALWGLDFVDRYFLSVGDYVSHMLMLDQILPFGSVAICGIFAELFMMVSLPLFEGKDDAQYLNEVLDNALDEVLEDETVVGKATVLPTRTEEEQMWQEIQDSMAEQQRLIAKSQFSVSFWELCADALRTAWLSPIMLTLVKPEVVLFLTGFLLTKFVHGAVVFGCRVHLPYVFIAMELAYIPTYWGFPRRTGSRRWWSIRGGWVYNELSAYWYSNIIRERELNGNHKHIFGYHPHGMFPMGAVYVHNTSQWIKLFPDIITYSLTATVTHIVPLLKDITQYNGGLEVSAGSFSHALMKFNNVLLVPGGQHEMLLFSDDASEILLSAKHKGFIRLALETAMENPDETINLVPIYVFGEGDMVYNGFPISVPMQRWLVNMLRLNPAFLPVGRFNLAGVPRRVPITFCVGAPLTVPVVAQVTEQHVNLLAERYYSAVGDTFDKHHKIVAGYESSFVTFVPPLPNGRVSKQEFETRWVELQREIEQNPPQPVVATQGKRRKEPAPIPEFAIAFILGNLTLWTPYFFFAPA